ncbi:MAG: PAS-domain containing protein [Pseudomonadota bacterium]
MQELDVALAVMVIASALFCAVAALLLMSWLAPPRRISWTPFDATGQSVAFLFEDEALVDATPAAHRVLETGPERMTAWPRLQAALGSRFPDIGEHLSTLGEQQRIELEAEDGSGCLRAEWRAGLTRIELDEAGPGEGGALEGLGLAALNEELAELRGTVDGAPLLVWKEDAAGAVRWANSAYVERALAADPKSETLSWPLPQLFKDAPWRNGKRPKAGLPEKLSLTMPADADHLTVRDTHFIAYRRELAEGHMVFALPGDNLVRAEAQLHEFVQTLTKTFAHLPIGLAVFDKDRRLATFNPALTDLTKLQPLFLSRRPSLFDFLDQLREARRMPEPKDYRDWRRKISELEHASAHGTHIETWALPDGTTLRVTGRPHPDGALAFLIQDITSEVSLTRRFRSELELGQAVVDSLDEAIAVFSASRDLVLCNQAYEALWETSSDTLIGPMTLQDAAEHWQKTSQPTPLWSVLREATRPPGERKTWRGEVWRKDGRALAARVVPLEGNALLVGFTKMSDARSAGRLHVSAPDAADGALRSETPARVNGSAGAPGAPAEHVEAPKPARR